MPEITLTGVFIVAAIAFAVPLGLGLLPAVRVPSVVLEIGAGILVGPAVFGLVEVDLPLRVLALLGLAFLLLLAGLEIDIDHLRGPRLRSAAAGFVISLAVALGIGFGLYAAGLVEAPLLVAIILSATSLGIVIPVLTDAGRAGTTLGQLVIAASSIADFGAIILLSLFFSGDSSGVGSTLFLIGAFVALVVVTGVALGGVEHSRRLSSALRRLQDTSAQIRVRGAFLLLVGLVVVAQLFGLEVILGAFFAGAMLRLLDRDEMMTHAGFHTKLQAVGFGIFIPFFFVTSGIQLDVRALFSGGSALALVPVFLIALLLARGVPAILYRPMVGNRDSLAAGLLQATSLPFIVAATGIGMGLGIMSPAVGAAMVVAGLLSVVLFPLGALMLLRAGPKPAATRDTDQGRPAPIIRQERP
ncbi:cation:proton antiporter [Rubrobacter tropicus]|uniref:Cation:proton antiporter n=2 Tax=Rubrobacter tropicus TaxID=2653851 RepID=A0A6G8QF12_9ACTN|nr:cation:proton antiporter [Rubrobacter tropicus]